ncbi:glutaminase A [Cyanobium sp. CH-040]|uniref:glutaminase A n=1 Tax=Cyanobium sp. CH-040 TaxID=2823708 RepID=UPI0020CF176D|nr:glutaminase A [Cyanobium sp. CH-040]MCP9926419.1 glutaminase A [Cyanobium sp. CH-040]
MPDPGRTADAIQRILDDLHAKYRDFDDGKPADYIPELSKANPKDFGIVIATTDGRIYEIGETRKEFTIQSISKPFTYALALKLHSDAYMEAKVGVEPSGDAFNAISLHPQTGIPRNPMINAGAIATTAQVMAFDPERAETLLLDFYSDMAGRRLDVNESVFRSERDTGHRNRAIGHLLRNFDIINTNPEPGLQLYFRQCAVSVTCQDLGVMAATLACQGRNPVTGTEVLDPDITTNVLAVMGSCGMYDYTGQWLYNVGMPAKSGVGGGVMAVVPGRLGLAVYSPPLDSYGNSSRGIAVCEEISERLQLHLFNQPSRAGTTIRSATTAQRRRSRRWRSEQESQQLDRHGDRIHVLQAQGVLDFAAAEELLAEMQSKASAGAILVIDLQQVLALPRVDAELLREEIDDLAKLDVPCLLCRGEHLREFWPQGEGQLAKEGQYFGSLDRGLEAAEDMLLEALLREAGEQPPQTCTVGLLELLPPQTRSQLEPLLERRSFAQGELVCRQGDAGDEVFLIESGLFSAVLGPPVAEKPLRFATFSPSVSFGEMAFLTRSPRTADVVADEPGSCLVLTRSTFDRLEREQPQVVIDLLLALHQDLARKLGRTNQQLLLLEQG